MRKVTRAAPSSLQRIERQQDGFVLGDVVGGLAKSLRATQQLFPVRIGDERRTRGFAGVAARAAVGVRNERESRLGRFRARLEPGKHGLPALRLGAFDFASFFTGAVAAV
jgi:hypothetical protein